MECIFAEGAAHATGLGVSLVPYFSETIPAAIYPPNIKYLAQNLAKVGGKNLKSFGAISGSYIHF